MRARPREINIFNMSLLDILCGALGAFCFMMLCALPYYVVGGSVERQQTQQKTEELIKELDDLRSRLTDPAAAEELRQMIDNLEAQVKQLEGQANQYAYENEQLKKEKEDLRAQNDLQERRIKQKKPFLVMAGASDHSQELDLYLQDDLVEEGKDKSANPPFDPMKEFHLSKWSADIAGATVVGHGFVTWVTADAPPGAHYRLFIKPLAAPKDRRPVVVSASLWGDLGKKRMISLPDVTLNPERFWTLLGTIVVDDDYKLDFKEATDAERDQAWRALMKSEPPPKPTPPPATPLPTIAPTIAPTVSAEKEEAEKLRREMQEKFRRERQGASPTPVSSEDERALRERLRKEREQRLATPTPSP